MKIEIGKQVFRMKVPLLSSNGTIVERRGFTVRVVGGRNVGRGEAFPLSMFGTEGERECESALSRFQLPHTPDSVESLDELLEPLVHVPTARFAVESALLEWMALEADLPVAALIAKGQPFAATLQVNALLEGDTVNTLVEGAKRAVDQGFQTLKLKAGARTLRIEAERLFAVRRAVGDTVKLRLDANQGWTESRARTALRGLCGLKLELCEQPLAAADVDGMRRLKGLGCHIAADESLISPDRRLELLRFDPRPAVDVLVLKPAVLGGLLPSLALARKAAEAGVYAYVTTFLDGAIARAACSHVAALVESPFAHGLSTLELFESAPVDHYAPQGGTIRINGKPGWGLS